MDLVTGPRVQIASPKISDSPTDILIPILSSLHGQDIARCATVGRSFADLIHSDLSLQYRIELAQNGMVDGESSTLPVSEKLERLRQYSSNFKSGAFQHQDMATHPDYVLQERELGWPRIVYSTGRHTGSLYKKSSHEEDPFYLSLLVPGSVQAGIPSARSFFITRDVANPEANVVDWAMDTSQDLFAIVDMTQVTLQEAAHGKVPEVYIRFYALSSLNTDTVSPHPAATLPCIRLHVVDSGKPADVSKSQVVGDYIILELWVHVNGNFNFFVDVYNWKTGQMMSTLHVGTDLFCIIPLDPPYLLLFPAFYAGFTSVPQLHLNITIYNFMPSPSASPGESEPISARHVCTLELPSPEPEEHITWSHAHTGDRAEETTGHFRADASQSIVVLHICIEPVDDAGNNDLETECNTYVLIPRATLVAQIRAADPVSTQRPDSDMDSSSANPPRPTPAAVSVPWADWGPRGCLRLRRWGAISQDRATMTAFGSRMPLVVLDGPEESASVYVFDVNPLVARSVLAASSRRRATANEENDANKEGQLEEDGEETSDPQSAVATLPRAVTVTGLVERKDIEKVLPGVVDPECAAIPYVLYRFPLPYSLHEEWEAPPEICKVTMSMAGFTVEFDGTVEYEKRFQTWTV